MNNSTLVHFCFYMFVFILIELRAICSCQPENSRSVMRKIDKDKMRELAFLGLKRFLTVGTTVGTPILLPASRLLHTIVMNHTSS